jgi:chemotaxis protein histidine kinase CheA
VSPDYFTEIESHFAERRGTPFVLNAKDWALMQEWAREEIPLAVVIEAIDAVFDRRDAEAKKVNGLSFCKYAVKEMWKERKELRIGSEDVSPEENVEPLLEALAARLEASAAAPFAARVRALAKEKSVPRVEEQLMELETELIDSLLPLAAELRAEARALTSGADEKTRARTEEAHLRRLVREKFDMPRLTLF